MSKHAGTCVVGLSRGDAPCVSSRRRFSEPPRRSALPCLTRRDIKTSFGYSTPLPHSLFLLSFVRTKAEAFVFGWLTKAGKTRVQGWG
uniref:Uncharacterized protein n=1 Tax=Arundo donax TaxID=35708 RepID=A0A0A9BX69_ARUDO